jgi:hypothetical protein
MPKRAKNHFNFKRGGEKRPVCVFSIFMPSFGVLRILNAVAPEKRKLKKSIKSNPQMLSKIEAFPSINFPRHGQTQGSSIDPESFTTTGVWYAL